MPDLLPKGGREHVLILALALLLAFVRRLEAQAGAQAGRPIASTHACCAGPLAAGDVPVLLLRALHNALGHEADGLGVVGGLAAPPASAPGPPIAVGVGVVAVQGLLLGLLLLLALPAVEELAPDPLPALRPGPVASHRGTLLPHIPAPQRAVADRTRAQHAAQSVHSGVTDSGRAVARGAAPRSRWPRRSAHTGRGRPSRGARGSAGGAGPAAMAAGRLLRGRWGGARDAPGDFSSGQHVTAVDGT